MIVLVINFSNSGGVNLTHIIDNCTEYNMYRGMSFHGGKFGHHLFHIGLLLRFKIC